MNYMKTALKMQEKLSKMHTVREFRVGEHVSVRIPRIDRSCTDLLRLPCIVVKVVGKAQSLHRLHCKSGVIQRCYQDGHLDLYRGQCDIPLDGWENEPQISLKDAAKKSGTLEIVQTINVIARWKNVITLDALVEKTKYIAPITVTRATPARIEVHLKKYQKGELALHSALGLCWENSI